MPYTPNPAYTTTQIITRLSGDATLASLVGTVLNRPPKREGPGVHGGTSSAFDADQRIKPTVYLSEATRAGGGNRRENPRGVMDRQRVYFVGPADQERKDVLRAAKVRVRHLLTRMSPDAGPRADGTYDPWYYRNEDGRLMFAQPTVIDGGFYTSEILMGESGIEGFLDFAFEGQLV